MKATDVVGQVFSRLTVVAREPAAEGKSRWRCICSCGRQLVVRIDHLRARSIQSCGCLQAEMVRRPKGPSPLAAEMLGRAFGRLTVLARGSGPANEPYWQCRCECGSVTVVRGSSLRSGATSSCGVRCRLRVFEATNKTHGLSRTPEWNVWAGMRKRCNDPKCEKYPIYGGRGIKVCARWDSFENFLADMGPRPSLQHSVDRYPDMNGNYEPGNCRWATAKEQANNTRANRWLDVAGKKMTVAQLGEAAGMSVSAIRRRLAKHASFQTPLGVAREAR